MTSAKARGWRIGRHWEGYFYVRKCENTVGIFRGAWSIVSFLVSRICVPFPLPNPHPILLVFFWLMGNIGSRVSCQSLCPTRLGSPVDWSPLTSLSILSSSMVIWHMQYYSTHHPPLWSLKLNHVFNYKITILYRNKPCVFKAICRSGSNVMKFLRNCFSIKLFLPMPNPPGLFERRRNTY